ncbi:MAG: 30S ribosomal protein S2 [Chloroflexi bacterium]|nr:30S ribosomal protein S2 [Chloroflexota bacterium]
MAVISMKALLETGVHFGHRTRKWNPRMKRYIFTERNGIHIIDLQQTLEALENVYVLVRDSIADGKNILFIGTKRQGQESIELEAKRCGMPYVNSRWLGGTLTNWNTIRSRITELENLEHRRDEGEFEFLTKKEALNKTRKIDKLEERLGGIRNMKGVPELIFVVDVRREETAIHEANLLDIPVIALVDTNCDPSGVDYVIPSNDDAIRAIKLLTTKMADAVLEGKALRKDVDVEEEAAASPQPAADPEVELTDEELLGDATLAKLQTGEYDEKRALPETEKDKVETVEEEAATPADEAEVQAGEDEQAEAGDEAEAQAGEDEPDAEKEPDSDQAAEEEDSPTDRKTESDGVAEIAEGTVADADEVKAEQAQSAASEPNEATVEQDSKDESEVDDNKAEQDEE